MSNSNNLTSDIKQVIEENPSNEIKIKDELIKSEDLELDIVDKNPRSCIVFQEDVETLYEDHILKEEMVLGPETIQDPQDNIHPLRDRIIIKDEEIWDSNENVKSKFCFDTRVRPKTSSLRTYSSRTQTHGCKRESEKTNIPEHHLITLLEILERDPPPMKRRNLSSAINSEMCIDGSIHCKPGPSHRNGETDLRAPGGSGRAEEGAVTPDDDNEELEQTVSEGILMSPLDFLDLEDEEASEEDSEDGIIEEVEIEEENLATKMANLDVGASAAVPIEQGAGRGARWARGQPLRAAGPATAPARADPAPRARLCRPTRVQGVELEEDASESEFLDCEPFVWVPMDEWSGKKETFLSESSGPTRVIENAYDAFRSFWDDSLLSHIVAATNRYARGVRSERFQKNWYETNVDELLVLFAFWMLMGIVKMPTVKSCFSKHIILRAEIYRSLFSEDRYWFLNRAFHFADDSREANDPCNVHHLMGPVLDQLNLKCQANYRLHQDICINKPSTLWKGQIGFKQCKKMKLAQCGTDIYELCESSTGYLWSFVIYTNDRTTTSTFNSSISSIIKLMKPLLNLGHVLYIDNWFNSPMLARYLKRRQTDCVGPVRATRTNVPAVIHETSLHEGEFVASQAGDVMVAALQDCQRLTWLSTFHDASQVQKEGRAGRPSQYTLKLIDDYNHGMGGVDPMDEMLQPYLVKRKQCLERTRKLFKRLLKVSIQNARVLLEQSSATKYSALSFRLALIQSIVNRHLLHVPREPRYFLPRPHIRRAQFPAARLTERHFVRHAAVTAAMRAQVKHRSNLARRQCAWCARHDRHDRQRKKTVYECPQCQVPLCLEVCFEEFHTVP